jgi:hypothetical protein
MKGVEPCINSDILSMHQITQKKLIMLQVKRIALNAKNLIPKFLENYNVSKYIANAVFKYTSK